YSALKEEFDRPLRDALKTRYDRFAVLRRWDYQNPQQCVFNLEKIEARGGDIPSTVEAKKVVLNVGGTWIGRLSEHEDESMALTYIRSKAFCSGQERYQVQLGQ